MPERCSCCTQPTEPEPGFYYGAMYCSYALCVGVFLINFFVIEIFLKLPSVFFITINTLSLLLLWPVIFRYARVIYLYFFVRYDPKAAHKH